MTSSLGRFPDRRMRRSRRDDFSRRLDVAEDEPATADAESPDTAPSDTVADDAPAGDTPGAGQ